MIGAIVLLWGEDNSSNLYIYMTDFFVINTSYSINKLRHRILTGNENVACPPPRLSGTGIFLMTASGRTFNTMDRTASPMPSTHCNTFLKMTMSCQLKNEKIFVIV